MIQPQSVMLRIPEHPVASPKVYTKEGLLEMAPYKPCCGSHYPWVKQKVLCGTTVTQREAFRSRNTSTINSLFENGGAFRIRHMSTTIKMQPF